MTKPSEGAQDMSNADDDSDGKRPLIPLRIPASLLSTLSSESQLLLNHNNINGDVDSLTVTHNKKTGDEQQTYPLEVTNSKQSTDWYTSTTNSTTASRSLTAASNKKELQHIGTSTKQYTINKPSKSNNIKHKQHNVKEIGKRTRRLLEEERAKRKEIVRLDDTNNKDLCLPPLPEEKAAAAEKHKLQSTTTTEKKVPQKSSKPTTTRKRKRKVAFNIDGYMPNVDHLLLSTTDKTTKDDYSNIIRLHGLPINVKPEHIRKFFHGLNPSLIFILPSFDSYIQGWDAISNNDNGEDNGSNSILAERHASNFRVYVKFTSSLVANAAIERMGEPIGLTDRGGEEDGIVCGKREMVGASIAMSPVPKHVALFIQKNMVSYLLCCVMHIICILDISHHFLQTP